MEVVPRLTADGVTAGGSGSGEGAGAVGGSLRCFRGGAVAAGYGPSRAGGVGSAIVAKLVFVNGKIVTVDDRFSVQRAVAVEDGKIIAVGSDHEALEAGGAGAEVTDLRGA